PPGMPPPFVTAASAWVEVRIASATRSPMAASRVRTVAVRLSSATAVVAIGDSSSLLSSPLYLATSAATSGSGTTVAVSMMRNCGHRATIRRPPSCLTSMTRVDGRDVVGIVAGFHHGVAAVEFDEEIVIVAAEEEIDRAGGEDRAILLTAGVSDGDDEIRAVATQRLGRILYGRDRRQEFHVFRARDAWRVVIGGAGEPDADAIDRYDGGVRELRQRRSVAPAQVGGIERERGLSHTLEESRLAEIKLMIAGREDVGCDEIGHRENVRTAVEARRQRGGERIARMCQHHLALGTLGLDNGGKAREAAAALPVRHHLICQQINVID